MKHRRVENDAEPTLEEARHWASQFSQYYKPYEVGQAKPGVLFKEVTRQPSLEDCRATNNQMRAGLNVTWDYFGADLDGLWAELAEVRARGGELTPARF